MSVATQQALLALPPIPPEAALLPLIKFPGGKRWLTPFVRAGIRLRLAAHDGARYVEPFFGGGAVGLYIGWPATVANDASLDLIESYRAIVADVAGVVGTLEALIVATPEDDLDQRVMRRGRELPAPAYYAARDRYNDASVTGAKRAALFLYLASRSFNGILRVNSKGKFNVPAGDAREPCYPSRDALLAFAVTTRTWTWTCSDFESACDNARRGDVLFADPPYQGTFAGYTAGGFRDADQVRLADALGRARDRGVLVLHTNADRPGVRALYRDRGFWMLPTAELRAVNSDGDGRKRVGCLIVSNAPEILATPCDDEDDS